MRFQTITAKQLAKKLDGREYLHEITPEEEHEAAANALVVVFGMSDDLMEFCGAIDAEIDCYEGRTVYVNANGGIALDQNNNSGEAITAVWCAEGLDFAWLFDTAIPHEVFRVLEDGEHYCLGIVFDLNDL